jgi:ribosomal protein L37E
MDRSSFESADPIIDQLAELIDQTLSSAQLSAIRQALVQLSKAISPRYSVNLNVIVEVFDPGRGTHALPLLTTGLSTSEGKTPYRTCGDSTVEKYVSEGEIQVVPHDRCPRCYGLWDFKFKNSACSTCGATLGRDVKLLLDTDVCPYCEEGKVSMTNPVCDRCGHRVDPGIVTGG